MIPKRSLTTSKIRQGFRLEQIVVKFLDKFKLQQSNTSSHLIDTVDSLIEKYQNELVSKLGVNGIKSNKFNDLWLNLTNNPTDLNTRLKRNEILEKSHLESPKIAYNNFLKTLYPTGSASGLLHTKSEEKSFSFISQNKQFKQINHFNVFKTYCELPQPRPLHIKPEHLNDLLDKFLTVRNFIKPNALSSSFDKPSHIIISTYNQMLKKRLKYIEMCSTILHDIREVSIPLTETEQNRILFLTFFKDKEAILRKVNDAINDEIELQPLEQTNKFNMKIFNLIINSYNDSKILIDTYNILLFHAIRHNQTEVISRILEDINLQHIFEDKDTHKMESIANHETFIILLDYFSSDSTLKLKLGSGPFEKTLDYFTSSKLSIDARVINSVIKGLISMKQVDLAEMYISEVVNNTDFSDEEDRIHVYKRLTGEDKLIYDNYVNAIESLKLLINDADFSYKVTINEGIFRALLSHYCSKESGPDSLDKTFYLLSTMEEKYRLPITTRCFSMIFDKFIYENQYHNSRWNLESLVEVTTKLIRCHDQYYGINEDSKFIKKLGGLNLYPQLNKFVEDLLESNKAFNIPNKRANLLKLSDSLINKIYMAIQIAIKNSDNIKDDSKSGLLRQIATQRLDLFKHLENTRGHKPNFYQDHPTRRNIYNIDETTYVKKGYIIDLIYLLSSS